MEDEDPGNVSPDRAQNVLPGDPSPTFDQLYRYRIPVWDPLSFSSHKGSLPVCHKRERVKDFMVLFTD